MNVNQHHQTFELSSSKFGLLTKLYLCDGRYPKQLKVDKSFSRLRHLYSNFKTLTTLKYYLWSKNILCVQPTPRACTDTFDNTVHKRTGTFLRFSIPLNFFEIVFTIFYHVFAWLVQKYDYKNYFYNSMLLCSKNLPY